MRRVNVRCAHVRSATISRIVALFFTCSGLIVSPTPTFGQTQPGESSKQAYKPCQVFAVSGTEDGAQELRADCNGQGVILGAVSQFTAITNDALQTTLIDARLGGGRRILLVSLEPDGQPVVEDLGGQIALAAGRGAMSELTGVELDFTSFAADGRIGVLGRPEDQGKASTNSISVGQQIAAERTRRQQAAAQD